MDTGTIKQLAGYFEICQKYAEIAKQEPLVLEIIVVSDWEERAVQIVEAYNARNVSGAGQPPDFSKNALNKVSNILVFTVTYINLAFYMENYKSKVASAQDYIKPKDRERFEEIKNSLAGNGVA